MRSVDIVVTEKCTMKCVDCSNLMQFFEKPESYEIDEMNNNRNTSLRSNIF